MNSDHLPLKWDVQCRIGDSSVIVGITQIWECKLSRFCWCLSLSGNSQTTEEISTMSQTDLPKSAIKMFSSISFKSKLYELLNTSSLLERFVMITWYSMKQLRTRWSLMNCCMKEQHLSKHPVGESSRPGPIPCVPLIDLQSRNVIYSQTPSSSIKAWHFISTEH